MSLLHGGTGPQIGDPRFPEGGAWSSEGDDRDLDHLRPHLEARATPRPDRTPRGALEQVNTMVNSMSRFLLPGRSGLAPGTVSGVTTVTHFRHTLLQGGLGCFKMQGKPQEIKGYLWIPMDFN